MAISILQQANASGPDIADTIIFGSAVAVGNVVVVAGRMGSDTRTLAIADNSASGQTWTALATNPIDNGTRTYVWYAVADETFTEVTLTASGSLSSFMYISGVELGGVDTADLFDTASVVLESVGSVSPGVNLGSLTTTTADRFLLLVLMKDSASEGFSTPSGWTATATGWNALRLYTQLAPTATSYGVVASWSGSATRRVSAVVVAFNPDAGGGGSSARYWVLEVL